MEKECLGQKKYKSPLEEVWDNEIDDLLYNDIDKIPEGICCVCGHKLNSHVNEQEYWRCHSLSKDCYQCECRLIKTSEEEKLEDYDLKLRMLDHRKEFAEGRG